ncbi:MAG: glyoxalase [Clostridiales bacterium]|nr:glyoxalase [Clostridiales bacterium]
MKYIGAVISVSDINLSKKFYQDIFGLEIYQDYGKNISFTCGLSLQEDFGRLVNILKEKVPKEANNVELYFEEEDFDGFLHKLRQYPEIHYLHDVMEQTWGQRTIRFYDIDGHIIEVGESMKMVVKRFLDSGLSLAETSKRMDVSIKDLDTLIR